MTRPSKHLPINRVVSHFQNTPSYRLFSHSLWHRHENCGNEGTGVTQNIPKRRRAVPPIHVSPKTPQCLQVPSNTFHKRPLPPHLPSLSSLPGQSLFLNAMKTRHLASFFHLMEHYNMQKDVAFCGLTSLCMILNALQIDPHSKKWLHPWRYWSEDQLECCTPLDTIRRDGVTVQEFYCLAACNALDVEFYEGGAENSRAKASTSQDHVENADEISQEDAVEASYQQFRKHVEMVTSQDYRERTGDEVYMVCSFARARFGQTGTGHYATVAAFSPASNGAPDVPLTTVDTQQDSLAHEDSVLLLDTAKFKYPSFFVSLRDLHEAMALHDPVTNAPRGYFLIRRSAVSKESVFHKLFQSVHSNISFRRFSLRFIEKNKEAFDKASLLLPGSDAGTPKVDNAAGVPPDVIQEEAASTARLLYSVPTLGDMIRSVAHTVIQDSVLFQNFERYSQLIETELDACETHKVHLRHLLDQLRKNDLYNAVCESLETTRLEPLTALPFHCELLAIFILALPEEVLSSHKMQQFLSSEENAASQELNKELYKLKYFLYRYVQDLKNRRFTREVAEKTQAKEKPQNWEETV